MNHTPRTLAKVGVAVIATLLAGCSTTANPPALQAPSSSAAPVAPAAARGVEAAINDVPWEDVGPGWTLATWSPAIAHRPGEERAPGEPDPNTAATTLFLVDPAANRYAITTFSGAAANLDLTDWSGDGSRA